MRHEDGMRWSPGVPDSLESLQIVFKVVERCNINCTYCYYFNMGDESALDRPARVTSEIVERLGDWLAEGSTELRIPRVKIAFHGGEPMLMPPRVFGEMCETLRRRISPVARLDFTIQTNGTTWSPAWLATLRKHRVGVGVSIDGDRDAHDRFRLDRRGRSTFTKTEKTIMSLVESAEGDPALLPGTISVLDHRVDYLKQYAYLRRLGVRSMSYLLPDRNADDNRFRNSDLASEYGLRMLEIFQAWLTEDDPDIEVRFVDRALKHFQVGVEPGPRRKPRKDVQILIVRSDGTVSVDDSYMPALSWYRSAPFFSVTGSSLRQVLSDPIFSSIEEADNAVPTACRPCTWQSICRGGDLENRFSQASGFNNPSIYCDAYKIFYSGVCRLLLANGYPAEQLAGRLGDGALV